MGKNKDRKKKGHGMEKTMAKTEKKQQKLLKKELEEIGEDDIETIIAQINEKDKELSQVKEDILAVGKFPPRRGGATFNLLPERDEFVLFGGDYFDGDKVFMYNDLHIYSLKKHQWTRIRAPKAPPPRTFHQSVVVSRQGGELWVFGGEFSSPSQSQFHHYNDLWVFRFATRQWQKVQAPNAPSPRSGHRMAVVKKHYLLVFGGYYDNLRNCRFYNDCHLFNLETNQWEEMKFSSIGVNELPAPRSACQLSVCSKSGAVVMYGGFSKEKQKKKDKEKAIVHNDMFVLTSEVSKKTNQLEWCWRRVKQSGMKPSDRLSFSMITLHDESAVLFGGVYDQEINDANDDNDDDDDDDNDQQLSSFFNDLYKLDLVNHKWTLLNLRGKKESKPKKPKAEGAASSSSNDAMISDASSDDDDHDHDDEKKKKEEDGKSKKPEDDQEMRDVASIEQIKLSSDEPFTLSFAAKSTKDQTQDEAVVVVTQSQTARNKDLFVPHQRRSSYLQFHKGYLYLYGGKFEDKNEREFTFNDMYCLNLKKLDEWRVIYEDREMLAEIKKAHDASAADLDDDDDEDGSEDEEEDDDEEDESDMEIDAPAIEPGESAEKYFDRTEEVWMKQAEVEFPDEKSKKLLKRMATELCSMFYNSSKNANTTKKKE